MTDQKRVIRYFGVCLALAVPGVIDPAGVGGILVVFWSVICAAFVVARAITQRTKEPSILPWLAWTGTLMTLGIIVRAIHGSISGELFPLPSPADLIHFPAYTLLLVLLFQLYRHRSSERDIDAWLDGAVLAQAVFIVAWLLFYGDFVQDSEIPLATRLVNAPYDIELLLTVMLLLRITATPGQRPHAYHLLGVGIVSLLVADFASAFSLASGAGLAVTVGLSPFVSGFTLAAVRHPSIHEMFREQKQAELRVGMLRLSLIGATILSPALIAWFGNFETTLDAVVLVGLSSLQACTVTVRVIRLLASKQRSANLERVLAAELSHIANLRSADEIAARLPASAALLAPSSATVRFGQRESATGWHIQLPEVLSGEQDRHELSVSGAHVDAQSKRLLSTLLRDAGLVASSIASRADVERAASQAEANRQIALNERRFRALVQNASDVVIVIDLNGNVSYVSESVSNVLGFEPSAFVDRTLEWAVHENDWEWAQDFFGAVMTGTSTDRERELRAIHADGGVRLFECLMTDMRTVEGIEGIVLNATDVTAKRSLERDLRDAETTDLLTLQLNRTAFLAETETAIRRASVSGSPVAVAIVNVDEFRAVNEELGTSLADQVLIEVAQAIRRSIRVHDVVARLNGDEFGVLMPDGYSSIEAVHAVQRIIDEIAEPITVGGETLTLQSTAGVVLDTDGTNTGTSLLRDADTALDAAKQNHRGETVIFEESMGEAASERIELRTTLETAIRENQLRLVYQPIVSIKTGAVVSMEALARWEHPTRGAISPAVFIPIAESTGLIIELGDWALRTVCTQVVNWAESGLDDFTVSVNMSGHQLREENIITRVKDILEDTGVDPRRITLEITESVLIDDTDFIEHRISALRDLGVKLAIDDFGTGYSSLSYLTRYEFDVLKIDRSFVIPLGQKDRVREREIVNSMIALAQSLGAVTVAEGIEEPEELEVLRSLGCDFAQGYLFWRPLELDAVSQAFADSTHLAA